MSGITRQFPETTEDEDGNVSLYDQDNWEVQLNVEAVTGFDESGEFVKANWEDVVCSIAYRRSKSSGEEDGSSGISLSIEECVTELQEAIEGDSPTDSVESAFEGEPTDRRVRALLEYFVEEEIVQTNNGNIVVLPSNEQMNDNSVYDHVNLLEGDDTGVGIMRTWTGYLERWTSAIDDQKSLVEDKLDHLETMADPIDEPDGKTIDELRSELYDITGGDKLEPTNAGSGEMIELEDVPGEIEDPVKRRRYKSVFNQMIMKGRRDNPRGQHVETARKLLETFKDDLQVTQREIEGLIQRMQSEVDSIYYNEGTIEQDKIDNLQETILGISDALNNTQDAVATTQQIDENKLIWGQQEEAKKETGAIEDAADKMSQTKNKVEDQDFVGGSSPERLQ